MASEQTDEYENADLASRLEIGVGKASEQLQEHLPIINDPSLPDNRLHSTVQNARFVERASKADNGITSEKTVLYLAYGSNLLSSVFKGRRRIKPLAQINVLVPELRLTFDQPGLPYIEPCFAATQYRDISKAKCDKTEVEKIETVGEADPEKASLMCEGRHEYNKDRWHKPLVGVVYEVSYSDYASIIASEGGGRGYKNVLVDCYPFSEKYDPNDPVPEHPNTRPFKAHSLLSPSAGSTSSLPNLVSQSEYVGVHPGWAQPSARYLDLINRGAAEHNLPVSYRSFLSQIRPYRVTTLRQRIGKGIFVGLWAPIVLLTLKLSNKFAGPDGRSPPWLLMLSRLVHVGMWGSYNAIFCKVFGEGERTIGDTVCA